ncbi:nuclear transport factor 2 family protein [Marinovum sp.]|uniref:nuclear transport factor 2 family protein n=1 Tax=Marinovum sp. TaxID=2024839 RepID=UPI003A8F8A5C
MNDYQAVMNLIGSYGQTVDEWPRQPERYADHFTEDGSFSDNGVEVGPRSKILALMKSAAGRTETQPLLAGTRHYQLNPIIHLEGDRGHGSVDLMVVELSPEAGWRIRGCGRYKDEYAKDPDGAWRFRSRILTWFKDAGPDPRNPALAEAYRDRFLAFMTG